MNTVKITDLIRYRRLDSFFRLIISTVHILLGGVCSERTVEGVELELVQAQWLWYVVLFGTPFL